MKIWIGLLAVLLMAGGVRAQEEGLQEVPLDDPAYEQIYELARIFDISIGFGNARIKTRYEFAIDTARILQMVERTQDPEFFRMLPLTDTEIRSVADLQKSLPAKMALSRLVKRFRSELFMLGSETRHLTFIANELAAGRMERLFTHTTRSFPDVAPSHWASEAVDYLRFCGVIEGYPGGNFNK